MSFPPLANLSAPEDGGQSPVVLIVVAAVFFLTAALAWRNRRQRLRNRPTPDDLPPDALSATRRAVDAALVEMLDASREISAQVDTKIRLLNRLVKDADDRIAQLRALQSPTAPPAEPPADPRPPDAPSVPLPTAASSPPAESPAESRRAAHLPRAGRGMARRVRALLDEGKTTEEIQTLIGMSSMELELVLEIARHLPEE